MNQKSIYIFLIICGIILVVIGNMFRIMHWPNGPILLIVGYGTISLIYPRTILQNKHRSKFDIIKGIGILIWGGFNIVAILYNKEHSDIFRVLTTSGLILWGATSAHQYFSNGAEKEKLRSKLLNFAFLIGTGILTVGMTFKFMHWSGALILLSIGGFIVGITLFTIFFSESENGDKY